MRFIRMDRRSRLVTMAITAAITLASCTANTGATDKRGLLPHLTVDMQLPEELHAGEASSFRIAVEQGGEPVAAERVTFEFWPDGHPDQVVAVAGSADEPGIYTAYFRPDGEGIYVVRCLVTSDSLEAMPAKRFAIGSEAVQQLATLEHERLAGMPSAGGDASGGHLHH